MGTSNKIGVIGASSMVGSRFCELSKSNLIKADLTSKISVDITNQESVDEFFKSRDFEVVILFSAFTNVDQAELQRNHKNESCWQINVVGAENISRACSKFKKKLIFISTDFIFDGTNGPYTEEDNGGPDFEKVSWYGLSKFEGEKIVSDKLDNFVILRISYPFRARFEGKADFAKQILKKYDQGKLYPLFFDQQITPTFIDDVAPCINLLLAHRATGIYHLASPNVTSPYEFGTELLRIFNRDPKKVEKGLLKSFLEKPETTPRPLKGGMRIEKVEKVGFKPTGWKQGLRTIFDQADGQLI